MLSGVPPASMAGSRARNPRRGREREEDVGLSFQGKRYVYVTRFSQSSTQLLYSRRNADAETKPISDRQSTKKLLYSFSGDHRYLPRPHLLCCAWCLSSITLIAVLFWQGSFTPPPRTAPILRSPASLPKQERSGFVGYSMVPNNASKINGRLTDKAYSYKQIVPPLQGLA